MTSVQLVNTGEFVTISNSLLSELKGSYPSWEDLISKTSKFHSSLKIVLQSSSAFIDALQKVADLASKTYGGSREIGTCLTRLCLRQKRLETKLKSMNNYLITSLATPLSNKLDEWRRALSQLEKDRARQTKRARADLKRAVSEADRWQKKAAKYGSSELGPGVGHGVLPSSNASGSKASVVAAHAANALREVQLKTEILESTEKASVRGLMLEERGRFCFFLSCLLPLLECQCSMLSEISAIEELMQPLSKAMSSPDQLMDEAEAILFRAGRGELAGLSRLSSTKGSSYSSQNSDQSNRLIAAATAALYADYDRANTGSSDDTDSGRLTMEVSPIESKMEDQMDAFSLSSATQSPPVPDTSVFIGNSSSNTHSDFQAGQNDCRYHLTNSMSTMNEPNPFVPSSQGYYQVQRDQRAHPHSGVPLSDHAGFPSFNSSVPRSSLANPLVSSCHLSPCLSQQLEVDDGQFQTLCRPGHCRSSSMGDPNFATQVHSPQTTKQLDQTLVESNRECNHHVGGNRPVVDPEWLRKCDEADYNFEKGADRTTTEHPQNRSSTAISPVDDDEGGEYVAVQEEVDVYRNTSTLNSEVFLNKESANLNSGRHTISSAYERGATANVRGSIGNLSFNTPIGKSSSKDSGVDSSTVLYPNQALPPPVYTNLPQLAHAAQRKFSIANIPPSGTPPSSPNRIAVGIDRLSGSASSAHLVTDTTAQSNLATTRQSAIHQSVNELPTVRSAPQNLLNKSPDNQLLGCRRASALPVSLAGSRSPSNGVDPFSMDLDELDRLGGTGSSCASSLTMASSTTSESQPSANGGRAAQLNNHSNSQASVRRPCSSYDTQWPDHCGSTQHELKTNHPASPSSWVGLHPTSSPVVHSDTNIGKESPTTPRNHQPFGIQPPANPISVETASLMSELSSQLQQLATRSVHDTAPEPPSEFAGKSSEDDFELPPPPPPSMFQTGSVDLEAVGTSSRDDGLSVLREQSFEDGMLVPRGPTVPP